MERDHGKRLCVMLPGHWSDIMGGSQYQAKCIIEEFIKTERYDIVYLTRHSDPNYTPEGYRLLNYRYPGALTRGSHRHLFELALLPKLLKEIKPDVIYQRVGCAQTGIAAHYARKNRCKLVWHIAHEYDLKPVVFTFSKLLLYRSLDRYMLHYGIKYATHIIAQTFDQKKLLESNFRRSPSAVIPNFHPAPKDPIVKCDPIKIVWVANLKAMKRPEVFIRLVQRLGMMPNTEFVMVGAIQGGTHLRKKYQRLIGATGQLKYLGPKSQEEVNAILSRSHIFVNTSRREGFPNTFIQAWLRKVPVVSLDVDPDQLIKGKGIGRVSGSFEKLADDVSELINNAELRYDMAEKAAQFAKQHFSIRNADKIATIMDSSAPSSGSRC